MHSTSGSPGTSQWWSLLVPRGGDRELFQAVTAGGATIAIFANTHNGWSEECRQVNSNGEALMGLFDYNRSNLQPAAASLDPGPDQPTRF